jgi:hypothetical protein
MTGFPGIPRGCVCAYALRDGRWYRIPVSSSWGCLADHREVTEAQS